MSEPKLINDLRPVVKKMLHVLVEHEIPMSSLEVVLDSLKDAVYTSTLIQERWANDDYEGYKNL
ncbi:hypothetical protein J2T12_005116 [Paenibacillus anaericanus]|nr:hypothetical protein [Paenibacillus anaericanus]